MERNQSLRRALGMLLAASALLACTGSDTGLPAGPVGSERDGDDTADSGLGDSNPEPSLTGATEQELEEGAALYDAHCVSCHGAQGMGSPFGVPLTRDMGLVALTSKIDVDMPQGDPMACTGECARLVALYVQERFVLGATPANGCDTEQPGPRQLRLLTRREYRSTVRDLLGIEPPDVSSLPVEPRVGGFDNNAKASVVTSRHADGYLQLGEALAERVLSENPGVLGCADLGCRDRMIREFGKRAFRRPLSEGELRRYQGLFAPELTEGSFPQGAKLMITAMLASPHFLYRSEVGEAAGGVYELTAHETASALSYLFVGTMPDATLMAAADGGELETPAQRRAQAERLLQTERAREQLANFATQWLRTEGVLGANKDADVYPGYTEAVRRAQMAEQARLFEHLFLERDAHFEELFLADYAFVNATLARFYGLADPGSGAQLSKVDAPADSGRGGILGLGAVMAAHAHQNESSPIKRGLFVRDRLLCQDLPDPPADLDTTPPGLDPSLTTRERFALHTSADACSSCHKYIDGVGFGLEGFDGVGGRRSTENGLPVDESGQVLGLEGLTQDSVDAFDGPLELAELLAESEGAQRCLARQYFRYAGGRKGLASDQCSIETLGDAFLDGELVLSELLVAVTQLETFTTREDVTP